MGGGLVLGPVVFRSFEVPEGIVFGGRQRLAVHALPGGGRVVDAMGAEEAPIAWSGMFSGSGAADRVRLLEQMRRDGQVQPLAWNGWRYSVVVDRFEVEAANPAWMPYRLKLCVVTTGDGVADDGLPEAGTAAEALALGAGPGLDVRIAAAADGLGSDDVALSIVSAGSLAQLVVARAFSGG